MELHFTCGQSGSRKEHYTIAEFAGMCLSYGPPIAMNESYIGCTLNVTTAGNLAACASEIVLKRILNLEHTIT
ncbi:hypothetical protein TNCV_4884351 [Trichonephila clavipes]|nr:hypothetical protein TNCV_4884351 [Trichonephila clavipes]